MKYAKINARSVVMRLADTQINDLFTPITDEQHAAATAIKAKGQQAILLDGVVTSIESEAEQGKRLRRVGGGWESTPIPYDELRRAAYMAEGITPEALAIATREMLGENRPEAFNALQQKVTEIKLRYPKP